MAVNAGVVYENRVKETIKNSGLSVLDDGGGGNFNSHDTDLRLSIAGSPVDIEIKGAKAQMGETSFRYDPDTGFEPVKEHLDKTLAETLRKEALENLQPDIKNLLQFFRSYNPEPFHESVCKIPFRVTRKAWIAARNEGLLNPVNQIVSFNEKLIVDHYNNKCGGVFYIQIEKRGLFYMGKNPLNLPIPALEGDVNVEIRLKRSGSKLNKEINEKVASATLVVVGRLNCDIVSPLSLDRSSDIPRIFS